MKTQAEFVAEAVANRSKVLNSFEEEFERIVAALVPLYVEDYKHQRWVRGLSEDPSIREVTENIERYVEGLAQRIKDTLWAWLIADGQIK